MSSGGNVYIADTGNFVVRVVNISTGNITTFAGNGSAGSTGDGLAATVATLMGPTAVAVDAAGNVYIADPTADRVRMVNASGVISTFAGSGSPGFSGDGGVATAAKLNYPSAVAVDTAGNVYIADTGNHRIRKVTAGTITTFAGDNTLGFNGDNVAPTATSLFSPQGVAVDSSGNVFIADTQNDRIREVSNGLITTVAGNGTAAYTGDRGAATAASLNLPRAVAVDSIGNIYIADYGNNVIRKVSDSTITTIAGTGGVGFAGDGGPPIAAQFDGITGIALDPTGAFTYVADSQNNAIRLITNTVSSGVIPQFAAGGNYVTGLYVVNKSSSPTPFTISFYNDQGTAVTVPVSGGSSSATISGNSFTDTIPALGLGYYEAGVLGSGTTLSGSAVIQSSSSIVVQALFRHEGAAATPYEAAVASTLGSLEAEFPFDDTIYEPTSEQISTGIAIVNIDGSNTASITCVARDNNGKVIASAVTPPALNPMGHWSAYQFPALIGLRGTLDCTSNTKIGVIALRFLGTDAVSTLPVILK